MANSPSTITKPIPRSQLSAWLPDHRAVKLLENLTQDVTATLPDAIGSNKVAIEDAQESADLAASRAQAAEAMAEFVRTIIRDLVSGPPPAPTIAKTVEDLTAQVAALREQIAKLTRRVNQFEERPTP